MTPQLWWWRAGTRGGVTASEIQARSRAEQAAIMGHCEAQIALVLLGFDRGDLEPIYVPTEIAYTGTVSDGRVAWLTPLRRAS